MARQVARRDLQATLGDDEEEQPAGAEGAAQVLQEAVLQAQFLLVVVVRRIAEEEREGPVRQAGGEGVAAEQPVEPPARRNGAALVELDAEGLCRQRRPDRGGRFAGPGAGVEQADDAPVAASGARQQPGERGHHALRCRVEATLDEAGWACHRVLLMFEA